MIRFENVSRLFAGGGGPAVDRISFEVPAGETCVLIGPSGCGKTTTLRMVNRLIEPTGGRILVGGEDISTSDPVQLRRRIGYVIQGIGLFPHMDVAENVATVPRLLGWPKNRQDERVAEMLALVGLEPKQFGRRRPSSLSGGQRQRVGVARALAADPPVMLMDEPFGAVDPVVRGRMQGEFRSILRTLNKTVIMVTHDIDEAIRMGDRIAVMRAGAIIRYDTPERLLADPADPFVADFVGADRVLKRLSLLRVGPMLSAEPAPPGPHIDADATLNQALSAMLAAGCDALPVLEDGRVAGSITLARIRAVATEGSTPTA